MVTVLPVAGLNVYPADPTTVAYEDPLVDPRTDSVCVRVCHAAAGGSFNTTRPTVAAAPRSTVIDCGNALFALSQYELAFPSTALPGPYTSACPVADTGRPAARFGFDGGVPPA